MNVLALLSTMSPVLTPDNCKLYLHQPVRDDDCESRSWVDPLELWKAGTFEEWQSFQSKGHFSQKYLVSFIRNHEGGYMFAGAFEVLGFRLYEEGRHARTYDMKRLPEYDELNGRLHVFCDEKPPRGSCWYGSTIFDRISLQKITQHKLGAPDFPGYRNVRVGKPELDRIIKAQDVRWSGPLSKVKGIYLISDMAKQLVYVGRASGADGFWGRWSCYSATGHGGNRKMIKLLDELSGSHAENFVFSILEIADLNTSDETLDERESHWKELLHTRQSLNAN